MRSAALPCLFAGSSGFAFADSRFERVELREHRGLRFFLPVLAGNDLGLTEHPAPNLKSGDAVTTEDGKRWRVIRYVRMPEEAPVQGLHEVESRSSVWRVAPRCRFPLV